MASVSGPGGVATGGNGSSSRPPGSLFLWHGRALFVGEGFFSPAPHQNHAAQIGVSLGGAFRIRSREDEAYESYSGFVVAPNATHHMDALVTADAPSVFAWTEDEDLSGRLAPEGGTQIGRIEPEKLAALMPELRAAVARREAGELACAGADALFGLVVETVARPAAEPASPLDPRVRRALRAVRDGGLLRLEDPIGRLAAGAHLSPSRFRHLFREGVGLSVQRYLLWRRLFAALEVH